MQRSDAIPQFFLFYHHDAKWQEMNVWNINNIKLNIELLLRRISNLKNIFQIIQFYTSNDKKEIPQMIVREKNCPQL